MLFLKTLSEHSKVALGFSLILLKLADCKQIICSLSRLPELQPFSWIVSVVNMLQPIECLVYC